MCWFPIPFYSLRFLMVWPISRHCSTMNWRLVRSWTTRLERLDNQSQPSHMPVQCTPTVSVHFWGESPTGLCLYWGLVLRIGRSFSLCGCRTGWSRFLAPPTLKWRRVGGREGAWTHKQSLPRPESSSFSPRRAPLPLARSLYKTTTYYIVLLYYT